MSLRMPSIGGGGMGGSYMGEDLMDPQQQAAGMGGTLGGMFSGHGGPGGNMAAGASPNTSNPSSYKLAPGGGMDVGATIQQMAHQNDDVIYRPGAMRGYGGD